MTDTNFIRCLECRALNEPRAAFCSRCGASLRGPRHGGPARRRQLFTTTSIAMGSALLIGLLILAFVFYTIIARSLGGGENVFTYAEQEGIPATISTMPPETTPATDETGAVVPPSDDVGSSTTTTTLPALLVRPKATVSSSALEATSSASFQATNLLDGDLSTPWLEGANGAGLGEWVRFEFAQPLELARIEIANGYQKDDGRFLGNPRVRLLKVEYSSGAVQIVQLFDVKDMQIIEPASEAVEWVRLVILSVYPGDEWQDTALSEVRIYEKTD
jgi:hypothetical protein